MTITLSNSQGGSVTSITIGGKSCTSVLGQGTTVTCDIPPGTGQSNEVVAYVFDTKSNAKNFAYNSPEITSVDPPKVAIDAAAEFPVAVSGSNLGDDTSLLTMSIAEN